MFKVNNILKFTLIANLSWKSIFTVSCECCPTEELEMLVLLKTPRIHWALPFNRISKKRLYSSGLPFTNFYTGSDICMWL